MKTITKQERIHLERYLENTGIDYDVFPTKTGLKFVFVVSDNAHAIQEFTTEEIEQFRKEKVNFLLKMVGEARKVQRSAQRS